MANARRGGSGAGTGTAGLHFCGAPLPGNGQLTEEWDFASTLLAGAWASGGNLNTARGQMMGSGAGSQTAALGAGGYKSGGAQSIVTSRNVIPKNLKHDYEILFGKLS